MTGERNRGCIPEPQLIEFNGKSQTWRQWSREVGVNTNTLLSRWKQYKAGQRDLDNVFKPVVRPEPEPKQTKVEQREKRVRCIDALINEIVKQVLPQLPEEVKSYMDGGHLGQGMKLYQTYKEYFLRAMEYERDETTKRTVAQMAVIVNPNQIDAARYKRIDSD